MLGHLANEHYIFCSQMKGEANPHEKMDFEKKTTKAEFVKDINDSIAYCDAAYAAVKDDPKTITTVAPTARYAVQLDADERDPRQRTLRQYRHVPEAERHRSTFVCAIPVSPNSAKNKCSIRIVRHAACSLSSAYAAPLLMPPRMAATVAALSATVDAAAADRHHSRRHQHVRVPPTVMEVPEHTRLLVVAPHPDDEMLGAGGLMQRVHEGGGDVRVVYLTDGEGYPEGVELRGSRQEADRRRLSRLRPPAASTRPSAALSALGARRLLADVPEFSRRRPVQADADRTGRSAAPRTGRRTRAAIVRRVSNLIVPDTEYRGEDLTQELAQIIGDFRPTLILVPRKEDQHSITARRGSSSPTRSPTSAASIRTIRRTC